MTVVAMLVSGEDREFASLAELSCNYRNGIYVTDYRTGDILRLDPMSMTDNGEAIIRTIRGAPLRRVTASACRSCGSTSRWASARLPGGQRSAIDAPDIQDGGSTWSNEVMAFHWPASCAAASRDLASIGLGV